MLRYPVIAGSLAALLSAHALAQLATPANPFRTLLANVEDPDTSDAALVKLKATADPQALMPIWDKVTDSETSREVKRELSKILPDIYARLRDARAKEEAPRDAAWNKKVTIELYEKSGHHGPRWDAAVRAGLAESNPTRRLGHLKEALSAGCDDLIVRFYAMADEDALRLPEESEFGSYHLDAELTLTREIDAAVYPDEFKFLVFSHYAWAVSGNKFTRDLDDDQALTYLSKAMNALPSFVAAKPGRALMGAELIHFARWFGSYNVDHQAAREAMAAPFARIFADGPWNLYMKSCFQTSFAWDPDGTGYGDRPAYRSTKIGKVEIGDAVDSLERAWKSDPLDWHAAEQMIFVCSIKNAGFDAMNSWFDRAMLANPDDYDAVAGKIYYMASERRCTPDELVAFAREMVPKGTGHNRIPDLLIELRHRNTAPMNTAEMKTYDADPAVWGDLKSAFEKLLAQPSDLQDNRHQYLADRAHYLEAAWRCQQWGAAVGLAKTFGDEIDFDSLRGKPLYDYFMDKSRKEVAGGNLAPR